MRFLKNNKNYFSDFLRFQIMNIIKKKKLKLLVFFKSRKPLLNKHIQ